MHGHRNVKNVTPGLIFQNSTLPHRLNLCVLYGSHNNRDFFPIHQQPRGYINARDCLLRGTNEYFYIDEANLKSP